MLVLWLVIGYLFRFEAFDSMAFIALYIQYPRLVVEWNSSYKSTRRGKWGRAHFPLLLLLLLLLFLLLLFSSFFSGIPSSFFLFSSYFFMHWMAIKRRCAEVFARRRRRRLVKVGGGRLSVRIAPALNGKCRQKPLECRNAIDKVVPQFCPPPSSPSPPFSLLFPSSPPLSIPPFLLASLFLHSSPLQKFTHQLHLICD